MPEDLASITPALSNFRSAFTITERVIPTRSATLLATRIPSFPSSSEKMCLIACNSENDKVLIAERTIAILRSSSAFSSFKARIISSPTTVVPYSPRIISSISYCASSLYRNNVPSRSPAISIGSRSP